MEKAGGSALFSCRIRPKETARKYRPTYPRQDTSPSLQVEWIKILQSIMTLFILLNMMFGRKV